MTDWAGWEEGDGSPVWRAVDGVFVGLVIVDMWPPCVGIVSVFFLCLSLKPLPRYRSVPIG